MDLKEYKQRNRKDLKLPSGLPVTIKKLSYGEVQEAQSQAQPVGLGAKPDEGNNVVVVNQMLISAVVGPFKLVQKFVDECSDDELSITDLENSDYEFLIKEVISFSGMEGPEKKSQATD